LSVATGCAHVDHGPRAPAPFEQAKSDLSHGHPERAYVTLHDLHRDTPLDLDVARALAEAAFHSNRTELLGQELTQENARRESFVNHYLLALLGFAKEQDVRGPIKDDFERAIALSPDTAELHYRYGVALVECEKYGPALVPLRRAVELAPGKDGYYLPLAKAFARTGDRKGAVRALKAMVAGHPTPSEVATARKLQEELEDPFAGFPKAAQTRLEVGLNWLRNNDLPEQAIIAFEDITHDFPDLGVVHALLGVSYQKLDDPGRAVEELRRAIELTPDLGKNYLYLGQVYFHRQRVDPAKDAFEKALDRAPLLDEAYQRLGEMALDRRDLPTAQRLYRTLTLLQPENLGARFKLATALQLDGDLGGAEHILQDALVRAPHSVDVLLRLGLLNMDLRAKASTADAKRRAASEAARYLTQVVQAQPQNAIAARALQALK
jgi:tetratricopeptide (TPR) repeat protein